MTVQAVCSLLNVSDMTFKVHQQWLLQARCGSTDLESCHASKTAGSTICTCNRGYYFLLTLYRIFIRTPHLLYAAQQKCVMDITESVRIKMVMKH